MAQKANATLEALSHGDLHAMQRLEDTLEESFEKSGLDAETFMLVRIAALTAMDAGPASWVANLKMGKELGISPDRAIGTLIAIAPVVGTARTVSAAGSILRALDIAEQLKSLH